MMTVLSLTVMMFLGAPATAQVVDLTAEKALVYQAALDYVEGVYEVNPAKIERSVHPNLTKYGFSRRPTGEYGQGQMTYQQLLGVAASWNKDGKRDLSIKKVEVLDVLDQTAVAKVTAQWGIDYMQLAKYGGQWKIINIIWQTHPVAPSPILHAAGAQGLTGKWDGAFIITMDGQQRDDVVFMTLTQTDNVLTGTVGPTLGNQWAIVGGKVDGTKVTFEAQFGGGGMVKFTLALADGRLKGDAFAQQDGRTLSAKVDAGRSK